MYRFFQEYTSAITTPQLVPSASTPHKTIRAYIVLNTSDKMWAHIMQKHQTIIYTQKVINLQSTVRTTLFKEKPMRYSTTALD